MIPLPSLLGRCRQVGWLITLICLVPGAALAQETKTAGQCTSVRGVFLAGPSWQSIKPNDAIPDGAFLLALFEARMLSSNGAVEVTLFGDNGVHGQLPVMETATRLHKNPNVDLEVTVERGIVRLTNRKKEGSAKVRAHILGETLDVELVEPGTKFGMEIYGRHAPGPTTISKDDPTVFLFFLTTKGRAVLSTKKRSITLMAPPGPAALRWDSIDRVPEVDKLEQLPVGLKRDAKEEEMFVKLCAAAHEVEGKDAPAALVKLAQGADVAERLAGVTGLGALDLLAPLLDALADPKHPEVRQQAILVLRNWLGREPGQIKRLQASLQKDRKLTAVQATSAVQLLIGFDESERRSPATYDLLIAGLQHSRLAIRELSYWHLVRLAPAGRDIAYDAAGSPEQRQQAVTRWRALIPEGQMPPRPQKNGSQTK